MSDLGLGNDWIMRWRLSIEVYEPEIMHIAGITSIVANAISRLDMEPTYHVSENILKGQYENDNICDKHVHYIRVSQSSQDVTDLVSTIVGE